MEDPGGGAPHGSIPFMDRPDQILSSQPGSGSFPLPPLDTDFFSDQIPLPETLAGDLDLDAAAADFDFDFSFDDLYVESDAEDFLLDPAANHQGLNEPRVLNSESQESDASDLGRGSSQEWGDHGCNESRPTISDQLSGDQSWDVTRVLNSQSPGSGCCDREFSGPESSQGSGNCGSGVSEAVNSLSQNSGSCYPDDSVSVPSSPDLETKSPFIIDKKKVKSEETEKNLVSKRKKGHEEENVESRTRKFRRSAAMENSSSNQGFDRSDATNVEDEKRKARLVRNRESAQLSRQRKKHYVEELEDKVRSMHSTIQDLNSKISYIMAENATLRQQLGGGGMCPAPPPGMYPHPPMAYPWVPCAPYVVKPQGSQVPLVPIPRLKPQQTVSTAKTKKIDSKKNEGKTKKVASVSFLGLLFFVLLFGGLVPMVNVKYGGGSEKGIYGSDYISNKFYAPYKGRVLTVNGLVNGSKQANGVELCSGRAGYKKDFSSRIKCERGEAEPGIEHREQASQPGTEGFDNVGNASKPLVASLYVPRNDKLVKIDGNLIIHSVLASEKAMASHASSKTKDSGETGLAIAGKVSSAFSFSDSRHPYVYSNRAEQKKALTSGSEDNLRGSSKSSAADGKLQQWFREGLAGPMLSSGMCTEVFQFDVSPAPRGMIPASSVTNITAQNRQNSTYPKKGRNRRVLHGLPIPLPGSNLNITEEHVEMSPQKDSFEINKTRSSVVVSVLVDPRETGDRDGDGIMRPKSLSRIFVVVLLDSVKYVTYSCVLPLKGSGPHLVTK